jgi:hypothetical protein
MADLGSIAQTVSNAGATVATLDDNYLKHVINQADVGRELIVKISADAGMTDNELNAAIKYITTSHGSSGSGDSAFVVAAVGTATGAAFSAGVTQVVFLRCQGTGDLTVNSVKAAAEAADSGTSTTFTVSIEAVFQPAN